MKSSEILTKQIDAIVKEMNNETITIIKQFSCQTDHHLSFATLWLAVNYERLLGAFG